MLALSSLAVGIIIGLLIKGVHIHHHQEASAPKEPLPQPIEQIPENMRAYAEKNHGHIHF